MPEFANIGDVTQASVYALDTSRHARILGAPGTGKSKILIDCVRRFVSDLGWSFDDLLVIAPNRAVGASLRSQLERAVAGPIAGTPVRTAVSLGFAVLRRARSVRGEGTVKLLTGAASDELLRRVIDGYDEAVLNDAGLSRELVQSDEFRTELREVWAVLDDFGIDFDAGDAGYEAIPPVDENESLRQRWVIAAQLVSRAVSSLTRENSDQMTANGAMRGAVTELRDPTNLLSVPRLVLVDDAQELSEGSLALLAALAQRGSSIWFFGDPDTATSAFQGEGPRVLADVDGALERRGAARGAGRRPAQTVLLSHVYRYGPDIGNLVSTVSARIGAAGVGQQRRFSTRARERSEPHAAVQFTRVETVSEQIGVLAYRLRNRHLGFDQSASKPWSEMAVVCRSSAEAAHVAARLAHQQVPTVQSSGGITLREHALVRDLIKILQYTLEGRPLSGRALTELLAGPLIGLDAIRLRRLTSAMMLSERQRAFSEDRDARGAAVLYEESLNQPTIAPESFEGRALIRLINIVTSAMQTAEVGGSPREVLWNIWEQSRLAERLQDQAVSAAGPRSEEAHRSLDAVMGLFFALQRHEEQSSETAIEDLLTELLTSAVPQDTLAAKSARDAVTVTTPQGIIGREFDVVCIVGPQDGVWPNLRSRGSVLGRVVLERTLRGDDPTPIHTRQTLHDELRLFVQACSRAKQELLVVAVANDETFPSPVFSFGRTAFVESLPSASLTLRGAVAEYRRRLTLQPDDREAAATLATLAQHSVPGADPAEWYGVAEPSTTSPLVDLESDPETTVPVSPSELERVEECALGWAIKNLGGESTNAAAGLGTLVHHALETVTDGDADQMLDAVLKEWDHLDFEAAWQSTRMKHTAAVMIQGLADYLVSRKAHGVTVAATESLFIVTVGRAVVRGKADRIEIHTSANGVKMPVVIDLKTGATKPSRGEVAEHAQLLAYQLGLLSGTFTAIDEDTPSTYGTSGGAGLLFVHPDARNKTTTYDVMNQDPLTPELRAEFEARVTKAAEVMAASTFTARVEHHCTGQFHRAPCELHIIPAVSFS